MKRTWKILWPVALPALCLASGPMPGGTLPIPQWIITGIGSQIDPAHSGGFVYDWFQARARDLFNANPPNPDVVAVLQTVSNYILGTTLPSGLVVAGYVTPNRSPQSQIVINPYDNNARIDSAGFFAVCGQADTHSFQNVMLHEARHAYQNALSGIAGNDQDMDYLVANTVPIAPNNIFVDSVAPRTVCNEFTGLAGATFPAMYQGDMKFDPPSPAPTPGDQSPYSDYAIEMDAHTFAGNHYH